MSIIRWLFLGLLSIIHKARLWWYRRRVAAMEKKITKMCTWIENYMKSSRLTRQERRQLTRSFGKMVFRLSVEKQYGINAKPS